MHGTYFLPFTKIRQELTYKDLNSQDDTLWSILITTGYLTQCEKTTTA